MIVYLCITSEYEGYKNTTIVNAEDYNPTHLELSI